jgi:hypothetical protein
MNQQFSMWHLYATTVYIHLSSYMHNSFALSLSHTQTQSQIHKICLSYYVHCFPKFRIDFDVVHLISYYTFLSAKPNKFIGEKMEFLEPTIFFHFVLSEVLNKLVLTVIFPFAGSGDSWGHNILNKIAQKEIFGSRMSKSSSSWWFKWEFI